MKLLSRLIGSLLVVAICVSVITIVINSTVLSNKFLLSEFSKTDSYSKLSTDLISNLTSNYDSSTGKVRSTLSQVLTPTFLKQQISAIAPEVESYYKGSSSSEPKLNIKPAIKQADRDGLAKLPGVSLPSNVNLGSNQRVRDVIGGFERVMDYSLIASLVLLILLLLVSWEQHRYTVLPDIVLSSGALIGCIGLIILILPSLAYSYLQLNLNNGLDDTVYALAKSIIRDVGREFLAIGIVLFLAGLIIRIILGRVARPTISD